MTDEQKPVVPAELTADVEIISEPVLTEEEPVVETPVVEEEEVAPEAATEAPQA